MRRRAFLSATTAGLAGLAGCSLPTGGDPTETLSPVEPPSVSPTPTPDGNDDGDGNLGLGDAELAALETGPRTLAMSPHWGGPDGATLTATFVATATPDHPARIRATLTNENDWANTFELREVPPFAPLTHAALANDGERETTLYLAPTSNHDLVEADPMVERGPEGYWRTTDVPRELPATLGLSAGESVTGEYVLVGHWERAGFPTGTYRFGNEGDFGIDAWHTERPGPTEPSWFTSVDVPSLPGRDEEERPTEWYHEADASTPVFLRPSAERPEAPAGVRFSLVNHSREPLTGNPYDWGLYKLADIAWRRIEPWAIPLPAGAVPPGDTWTYTLRLFHGRYHVTYEDHRGSERHTVGMLGGGTYAFEAGFARENHGEPAALFQLDAPRLAVSPPPELSVEREEDRVVVTDDAWGDGQHSPDARLAVARADGADRRVLPEQLYHGPLEALRSVLPFFEPGVSTVVLRTDVQTARNVLDPDAGGRRFRYDGEAFAATVDVVGT